MANGADIAKAYVQIIPSADGIKGKLSEIMGGEAESAGKSSGGKFASFFSGALKTGGAIIAGMGAATTALAGSVAAATSKTAEFGDNIDKMSQKMGLSATAYQEWDAIMQHSGTSIETMKAGMKTLANAVESGNGAFERIGLSMEDISSMSNEDLFAATIAGLQNVDNETERTYLAGQLLGRGATELGALLNTSAEDTEAMRQRVHELGGVMSDEAVKASAAYQDSLQDMQTALSGLTRNMTAEFLPSVTTIMDGLTELFSGGDGMGQITEGINSVVGQITAAIPKVLSAGGQIIGALAQAVITNLPMLASAASGILMQIGSGIVENLPMLIETAFTLMTTFASGLAQNLPTLIPAAVDAVITIVEGLIDNIGMLVDASIEIIMALSEGLIAALPRLIEKAPEIISKLVTALIQNVPKLLQAAGEVVATLVNGIVQNFPKLVQSAGQILTTIKNGIVSGVSQLISAGRNLVEGIWQGISNSLSWIKQKITGWVGNVVSFIKNLFGIHSPSTVMRDQVGRFLALGIGEGFTDTMPSVEKDMLDAMPDFGGMNARFTAPAVTHRSIGDVSITVNGTGKNAEQIARELQSIIMRKEALYA